MEKPKEKEENLNIMDYNYSIELTLILIPILIDYFLREKISETGYAFLTTSILIGAMMFIYKLVKHFSKKLP